MLTPHPSLTDTLSHKGRWLIMFLLIVAVTLLFARKRDGSGSRKRSV